MTLSSYLRRALSLPVHVAALRATQLGRRILRARWQRYRDLYRDTHGEMKPGMLARRIELQAADVPADLAVALPVLCKQYCANCFDLLGSGWIHVRYGLVASGIEGHHYPPGPEVCADDDGLWLADHVTAANLTESRRLWRLISRPYEPIDWQLDFKSGYRWDARRHSGDLVHGHRPGVDVKVPWELARLQHLPQLAIAHLAARAGQPGFCDPEVLTRAVRNQIIDFLATNPPRFGINWTCPMDVAIRAANILVAVDLLRAGGWEPDPPFMAAMVRMAAEHGRHVLANLEWSPESRNNHYLSDLAGLLYCAAYLPADLETDAWLAFGAHQLGIEIPRQFLRDGGNFEGSTSYHRLSTEIALFCSALLLGTAAERAEAFARPLRGTLSVRPPLPRHSTPQTLAADGRSVPLPAEAVVRLKQAVDATHAWLKPDGRAPQIGDNDSGRFFKLHPLLRQSEGNAAPVEQVLDHRHLLSLGDALLTCEPSQDAQARPWIDGRVARSIAGGRGWDKNSIHLPACDPRADAESAFADAQAAIWALPRDSRGEFRFDVPGLQPDRLVRHALPQFGLFIYRGQDSAITLRCDTRQDRERPSGHTHDDNLALELYHNGRDLIADPGSYLYTPLPQKRDQYRAASAHFAPRGQACPPAAQPISLFELQHIAHGRCLYFGQNGIAAVLNGPGWRVMRVVVLARDLITVLDGCNAGPLLRDRTAQGDVTVSEGYGRVTSRPVRLA